MIILCGKCGYNHSEFGCCVGCENEFKHRTGAYYCDCIIKNKGVTMKKKNNLSDEDVDDKIKDLYIDTDDS